MNLVVQGQKVETRALKDLTTLTGSEGVGRLGNNAFRLRGARPRHYAVWPITSRRWHLVEWVARPAGADSDR